MKHRAVYQAAAVLILISPGILLSDSIEVIIGRLIDKSPGSITVASPRQTVTLRITPATKIWKGSFDKAAADLDSGDQIAAKYRVAPSRSPLAVEIWANLINVFGVITDTPSENQFIVLSNPNAEAASGYKKRQYTVHWDPNTSFMLSEPGDLKRGRNVQIIGVETGDASILAARVTIYEGTRPVRMDRNAIVLPRR